MQIWSQLFPYLTIEIFAFASQIKAYFSTHHSKQRSLITPDSSLREPPLIAF